MYKWVPNSVLTCVLFLIDHAVDHACQVMM